MWSSLLSLQYTYSLSDFEPVALVCVTSAMVVSAMVIVVMFTNSAYGLPEEFKLTQQPN
jgi:hypothetical protein